MIACIAKRSQPPVGMADPALRAHALLFSMHNDHHDKAWGSLSLEELHAFIRVPWSESGGHLEQGGGLYLSP